MDIRLVVVVPQPKCNLNPNQNLNHCDLHSPKEDVVYKGLFTSTY
jgi:hypothetical protein